MPFFSSFSLLRTTNWRADCRFVYALQLPLFQFNFTFLQFWFLLSFTRHVFCNAGLYFEMNEYIKVISLPEMLQAQHKLCYLLHIADSYNFEIELRVEMPLQKVQYVGVNIVVVLFFKRTLYLYDHFLNRVI